MDIGLTVLVWCIKWTQVRTGRQPIRKAPPLSTYCSRWISPSSLASVWWTKMPGCQGAVFYMLIIIRIRTVYMPFIIMVQ